jgi:putative transposase
MIPSKINTTIIEILEDLAKQGIVDLSPTLQKLFNELMLIEREQVLKASPYERTEKRQGYANGFKNKTLQTRIGRLDLDVPQTRNIEFYPSCLEKGTRSERALKLAIAESYVQGVSTRKMKKVAKELCGYEISSSQVSRLSKVLDEDLEAFRNRPLGKYRYVYLDARYEKVRQNGHVVNLSVHIGIGINENGFREILGVSVKISEAEVHWRDFLESLQKRGMSGIELIISDNHSGLKAALKCVFPSVPWQRCIFHLAQNAQNYSPKQSMRKEIAQSVRDIYQALSFEEAKTRIEKTIEQYKDKAPRFVEWLEENFEEGLAFYKFPREHWRKIRTSNGLERINQEIKRRTSIARLFPNEESCKRLITAILVEIHEDWISGKRYMTF